MHINLCKEKVLNECKYSGYFDDVEDILGLKSIELKNIIKLDSENTYKSLEEFKDKVGIYIFLNTFYEPVYVGLSGVFEQGIKSNLFQRITNQLINSSHLVKNIVYVENLLNVKKGKNLVDKDKQHILTYAPYLIVYSCGTNIKKAQDLESIFLSLLQLKYNR